jgi:hypothetical protein
MEEQHMSRSLEQWKQRLSQCGLLLITIAVMISTPVASNAALLGNTLTFPYLSFDNQGTTSYDAASNQFLVNASPLAIRLSASDAPATITPAPGLGETFVINVTIDETGTLTGGAPGNDLLVEGEVDLGAQGFFSGVLLTGEIAGFGFQDSGGTTDYYDFGFDVTGGQLAAFYSSAIGVSLTSEQSNFTGDFSVDFGGEAKGTLGGVVPIPPAAWLFGSGLLGMIGIARRKKAA